MKFYIDNKEVKTINTGASIKGTFNSPSRTASFSYIYKKGIEETKAKYESSVLIENDDNKPLFRGLITKLVYYPSESLIEIEAKDLLSTLLETKIEGRYKGTLIEIISELFGNFDFLNMPGILNELNIVSLGGLSAFDIIQIAVSQIFGDDIKIYLDGNSKFKILIPSIMKPDAELITGRDIISAVFMKDENSNSAKITAFNNDNVISGSIIKIKDKNIEGCFLVESDIHTYSYQNTMTLNLKERRA